MLAIPPVLIGLPYDAGSSYLRGAAEAPPLIRRALASPAGNGFAERGVEVLCDSGVEDRGDLVLPPTSEAAGIIEAAIGELARVHRPFLALGGDHAITYPILRGLAEASLERLTILQIDAHPDLYDEFEGRRDSHACPFARIMEDGLAAHLVQVGIRASTAHQRTQAGRFGVEQIDMRAWVDGARPAIAGDVYVSIDVDAIDPAFAPGVSHREPGGLTVRDVLGLLLTLDARVVGADLVEYNPRQDVGDLTAGVAAKIAKEILATFQVET